MDDDDYLNVEGIFMLSDNVEAMKTDLFHTGNLIWDGIKTRITNVLFRPWEAFANKEHQQEMDIMQGKVQDLISENLKLKEALTKKIQLVRTQSVYVTKELPALKETQILLTVQNHSN